MTTIQGVADLGPGLRLHLNENTGGCSQKVVDAVRAFDGPALATYPDFRDAIFETAAFLGVDPDRIVLTNGLDEGILLVSIAYLANRTPEALVALGAPPTTTSGTPEVLVAQPAFEPYLHGAQALGARVVSVPAGKDFAFPLDGMLRAITLNTRLVYVNNPNNPNYDANRGVWDPTVGGAAPYQEKIFGLVENPPSALWTSVALAYPNPASLGNGAAPLAVGEPNCASPTNCASTRSTHAAELPGPKIFENGFE